MKYKLVLIFLIVIMLTPMTVSAHEHRPIDKLDNISDEALQMIKFQRYDDGKKLLSYFSDQLTDISNKEHPFTRDELRIITVSHNEAMEAAASPSMEYEERVQRLTKFRLVVDAIATSHQPLWTEMKNLILTTFQDAKEAANTGDSEHFHSNFNNFMALYNVIYPSMKIDVSAENIQRIDARINFIDEYRSEVVNNVKSQQELEGLEMDLKNLFENMDEDEADPSLWWVIISTGSIIISTLSYVGFRKYQGEKDMRKNRSRVHKD